MVLVLRGLFGDVLQQTLTEDLRQLGVSDLSQIRSGAGLDVGRQLLDHVLSRAIELGGLDLDVRVVLVPLGHDVIDQRHALFIRQAMHVGDRHLFVFGGIAAVVRGRTATGKGDAHDSQRRQTSKQSFLSYHIPNSSIEMDVASSSWQLIS